MQVEQLMVRPDRGKVQGDEAGYRPEQAARQHAQQYRIIELAYGAGEWSEHVGRAAQDPRTSARRSSIARATGPR